MSTTTNDDGRTAQPLLEGAAFTVGTYELAFDVGGYFRGPSEDPAGSGFLGVVPIRFTVTDRDAHYHVPLLASPWSYTTYRGS